jgi:hypothetical protein
MKYWGYLFAKLTVAAVFLWAVQYAIGRSFPHRVTILRSQQELFAHDLTYTSIMMLYFLLSIGVLYLVGWDQRYRCRTCLRRLRMPVFAGSWPNSFLKGEPRLEYICTYGHGTLKVPELELTGSQSPNWEQHDDMWKELESFEAAKR